MNRILIILLLILISGNLSFATADIMDTSSGATLLKHVVQSDAATVIAIADSARDAGDYDKAMNLYLAAAGLNERKPEAVTAYIGAGDIQMRRCDYAGALDNYIRGLKISETMPGMPLTAVLYKNIGNVYTSVNDYEKGIYYYKEGLAFCRRSPHKDTDTEWRLLMNLARFNAHIGNTYEAEGYLVRAHYVNAEPSDLRNFMYGLNEGLLLSGKKNYNAAIPKFKQIVKDASDTDIDPRFICSALQQLYLNYSIIGRTDSAFDYMKRCERLATESNVLRMYPEVLRTIADHYRANGDMGNMLVYITRYLNLKDSISSETEVNSVKNSQFQYETSKMADKINTLHRQKNDRDTTIRRQSTIMWVIAIAAILLAAMLIVIYIQKRRITESYRALFDMNKKIEDSNLATGNSTAVSTSENAIKEEENENSGNSEEDGKATENGTANRKYISSKLDDSRMTDLAEAIARVMNEDKAYTDQSFSLDTLAEIVESNSKYVSQTINEAFGKNFSTYVNDYRVSLARQRLVDQAYSNYTIRAIGESVGFGSQSTFTFVFRKTTGLSPSVYQKMARENRKHESGVI